MTHSGDILLFRLLNGHGTNAFMDSAAAVMQSPALGFAAGAIGLILALSLGGRRGRIVFLACVAAVIASDLLCTHLFKPWAGRLRPSVLLEGVRLVLGKKSGFGFPSNHAANMMSAAWVLVLTYPRAGLWAFAAALFVGYTRIYSGVHFPSDVAGGFLVGLLTGTLSVLVAQRYFPNNQLGSTGKK